MQKCTFHQVQMVERKKANTKRCSVHHLCRGIYHTVSVSFPGEAKLFQVVIVFAFGGSHRDDQLLNLVCQWRANFQ